MNIPECDPLSRQRPTASAGLRRHARGQASPYDRPAARRPLRSGRTAHVGERCSFQQLLLSFKSILPLRQRSEFRDSKVHQRILSLTEGVLVRICRLLETAAPKPSAADRSTLASPCSRTTSSPSLWSPSSIAAIGALIPMITTHAPLQLPFGPKPFRNQLCSS